MRDINDFKEEIADLVHECTQNPKDKNTVKRNRISELRQVVIYLERNPSEEFIVSELARMKNKLRLIEEGYPLAQKPPNVTNKEAWYNEKMGVPEIKLQIKILTQILS